MIDHIEQYLKQHHCRDYFNSYGELVEDDHYYMYREEVLGLIELIVRECMTTVLKESKWYWDKGELESSNAIQNAARRVKEHFGVE